MSKRGIKFYASIGKWDKKKKKYSRSLKDEETNSLLVSIRNHMYRKGYLFCVRFASTGELD